ncbi:hypothetical protein RB595_008349 [Gaeumannomyces hyphopodioides]
MTSSLKPGNTARKTILFLGATGGCGFSVLRRSLDAGHTCIALCRTPSKLTEKLGGEARENLTVLQGNAKDTAVVSQALLRRGPSDPAASSLVDAIVFALGGVFSLRRMGNDDPDICRAGMEALLSGLSTARSQQPDGSRGGDGGAAGPRIYVISTTGISEQGRDVPLAMLPMYSYMLKEPHRDKKAMEDMLVSSGEAWTIVRPSFLTDESASKVRKIRVGVEDPVGKVLLSKDGVGYTISREEVGRWMFESLVEKEAGSETWVRKIATITH